MISRFTRNEIRPSISGGTSGMSRVARVGRDRCFGRLDVGVGVVTEREVAGDEPHHVVAADALVGQPALVEAVGVRAVRAEVPDGHLRRCRRRSPAAGRGR